MGNDIYTGEFPWYRCDKAQSPWVVKGAWDLLSARWITKLDRYRRWLGIYKGKGLVGINLDQWAQYLDTDTINLNVTKSVIDALVSKISTNAPREVFLTDKGNWEKQRKAQNGTFIVDGIYHDQRAYQKARRAFFHACLWGTGFLQSYPCKLSSRVQNRVVPVTDLRWDEREARNDDLRSLFVRHVLPVGELLERFKVRYDDLKGSEREEQNRRSIDDRLVVYEAFHLPSAPGATDGLHVIQTSDVNLRWKPKWQVESKKPRFPIARFRYGNSAFGWEGEGVCENTEGIQDELTFIAQKIQRLFNAATVRGWVKEGSNVNPEGITNEEFVMGTYLGDTPPVFAPDIPVHPQYFQRIAELKQDAYELNGLSEMFARGRVPSNLQSAVAIQEARDEQGERYQETNEDFEEFHRDIAENDIQAARELAEDGPYEILVSGQAGHDQGHLEGLRPRRGRLRDEDLADEPSPEDAGGPARARRAAPADRPGHGAPRRRPPGLPRRRPGHEPHLRPGPCHPGGPRAPLPGRARGPRALHRPEAGPEHGARRLPPGPERGRPGIGPRVLPGVHGRCEEHDSGIPKGPSEPYRGHGPSGCAGWPPG